MPLTEEELNAPAEPGSLLASFQAIAAELAQPVELETPPAPEPVAAILPPPPAPESNEPKVLTYPDGSSVTIEKGSKGWKATLEPGNGSRPEVFYGNTKDEMWQNVAVGKLNATKKIRELNRSLKLGTNVDPAPAPVTAARAPGRELTAEEQFTLNAKFQTNPSEALDELFRIKYGTTPAELVQKADKGERASREITMGEVAREFRSEVPEYLSTDANYEAIVGLLAKNHLRRALTPANRDEIINSLVDTGAWSVSNLVDAYEELADSGLLEIAPVRRATPPAAAPETPAATVEPDEPPPTERIVRTERRPRAGFGLRANETSSVAPPPVSDEPPSVEDLNNLSSEEIAKLFQQTVKYRQKQLGRRPQ